MPKSPTNEQLSKEELLKCIKELESLTAGMNAQIISDEQELDRRNRIVTILQEDLERRKRVVIVLQADILDQKRIAKAKGWMKK